MLVNNIVVQPSFEARVCVGSLPGKSVSRGVIICSGDAVLL
jgi:hypothetical protein